MGLPTRRKIVKCVVKAKNVLAMYFGSLHVVLSALQSCYIIRTIDFNVNLNLVRLLVLDFLFFDISRRSPVEILSQEKFQDYLTCRYQVPSAGLGLMHCRQPNAD